MSETITHVYFVPGLAAGKEIFKHILLPEDQFTVHFLKWLIPNKKESIEAFSKRMAAFVKHENSVLIGVSFGGLIAQEMAAFLNLKKLIIISSIKSRDEMPQRLKTVSNTFAYKLMPSRILGGIKDLTSLAIGPKSKKRLELYQMYLSVRDRRYLNWAVKNMVCWNREKPDSKVIHIHGDKDGVFPIKNIDNCIVLKGGTHIMIINKFKWLNEQLPIIINS